MKTLIGLNELLAKYLMTITISIHKGCFCSLKSDSDSVGENIVIGIAGKVGVFSLISSCSVEGWKSGLI